MTSKLKPLSSALRFSPGEDEEEAEDLSSEMPDTSLVRRSLMPKKLLASGARVQVEQTWCNLGVWTYAVFSRCFCLSSSLGEPSLDFVPGIQNRQQTIPSAVGRAVDH